MFCIRGVSLIPSTKNGSSAGIGILSQRSRISLQPSNLGATAVGKHQPDVATAQRPTPERISDFANEHVSIGFGRESNGKTQRDSAYRVAELPAEAIDDPLDRKRNGDVVGIH